MKTKVLFIITKNDIGGAQKYAADLASHLDKNRFEIKILYGGQDLKWLSNRVRPELLFINDWLSIIELIKTYNREKPNIIHLNSSKTGVLGSLAAFLYNLGPNKTKVVFTAHGWVFNPTNAIPWLTRWFYIWLHKLTGLFQDKIICVSEYDYQLALNYRIVLKTKLETIYNGVDASIKFLDKKTARQEILKKLSISNYQLSINEPWIGSIGRLVKEKNYETLIQAASLIPNANFFIIGQGVELENLKSKSLNLKTNVLFIEPSGNDSQYLKAFDVFAMSSIKEGLPYILLEAMSAGLPSVVTETGGMPEMIKNHENGLMVAQKNPEMLAKAIQGLIANLSVAAALGKTAQKAIQEKFSLKKMITETERLYQILTSL